MKAIHNGSVGFPFNPLTVFNTSKIQNESNSQHNFVSKKPTRHCVQYVKDTK